MAAARGGMTVRIQAVATAFRTVGNEQLAWRGIEPVAIAHGSTQALGPALAAALSPDGTQILTVRDDRVLCWQVDRLAQGPRPADPLTGVVDVAFDTANHALALVSMGDAWMLLEYAAFGHWTQRFHGPGRPLGLGGALTAGAARYAPLALARGLAVLRFGTGDPLLWWAGRADPPDLPPALFPDEDRLLAAWTRRTRIGWRLMAASHLPAVWPPHWLPRTVAEGVGIPLGAGIGVQPPHLSVLTDRGALRGPRSHDRRWEFASLEAADAWEESPRGRLPLRFSGDAIQATAIRRVPPDRR